MKINVALDRLPSFPSRPDAGPALRGTIHLGAARMSELEDSFAAACAGGLPERPMIEMTIPSTLDDTLAPPDKHVACAEQASKQAQNENRFKMARQKIARKKHKQKGTHPERYVCILRREKEAQQVKSRKLSQQ